MGSWGQYTENRSALSSDLRLKCKEPRSTEACCGQSKTGYRYKCPAPVPRSLEKGKAYATAPAPAGRGLLRLLLPFRV
ncbi:hypothetical protein CGRA01v4_01201 [Colletotrichum graminicola]|nr:hypothetical protein CGRA01v4_01201 [Colletotrichum graminicola]